MEICHPFDIRGTDNDKWWMCVGLDWIWVKIFPSDEDYIRRVASHRSNSRTGSKNNFAKGDRRRGDILGCAGEEVVGFLMKKRVEHAYVKDAPDVGEFEVKTCAFDVGWRLTVNHSTLKPHRKYINCMTYLYPKFVAVQGWTWGHEIENGPEPTKFRERELVVWTSWHTLKPIKDLIKIELEPASSVFK